MRDPGEVGEQLLSDLRQCKLVAIDGKNSSGKTTLCRELVELIGGSHIEVDDYLDTPSNGRKYRQQVKLEELKTAIAKLKTPVFLDCFIAMDVLEEMQMVPDVHLHCKKVRTEDFLFVSEDKGLKAEYADYEKRRNPTASAREIFTLFISN